MKKMICMMLAFLLMLSCSAWAEEDWYLDTALELAGKMGELAKDDAYIQMMTSQTFACMEPLKTAVFSDVVSAYRCELPDEAGVRVLLKMISGWEMSDAALQYQTMGLPKLPLTLYAGTLSSEILAATSMLTYSMTYVAPEGFVPCLYVLELDGAYVGAAFMKTGEETVTVQVQPLFAKEGGTFEDVLDGLNSVLIPMEVEQVR